MPEDDPRAAQKPASATVAARSPLYFFTATRWLSRLRSLESKFLWGDQKSTNDTSGCWFSDFDSEWRPEPVDSDFLHCVGAVFIAGTM